MAPPRVHPPSPSDPHAAYDAVSDGFLRGLLLGSEQHTTVPTGGLSRALALPSSLTPVLVQVLVRHGDRSPVSDDVAAATGSRGWWRTCPSGPSAFSEAMRRILGGAELGAVTSAAAGLVATCGRGQLTVRGVSQCLDTGRHLREHYVVGRQLLGSRDQTVPDAAVDAMERGLVVVRSTVVPRAIESAQAILRALFPHSDAWRQTHRFDIRRDDPDDHLTMSYRCPTLMQYYRALQRRGSLGRAAMGGDDDRALDAEMRAMFGLAVDDDDSNTTTTSGSKAAGGSKRRSRTNVTYMFDNLACRLSHGMPMPSGWTWDHIRRAGAHATAQYFAVFGRDTTVARLGIGRLVAEVHDRMAHCISGERPARFVLYSGHDTTLAPFLESLGAADGIWPRIASVVIVELLREEAGGDAVSSPSSQQQHFVRLFYNGRVIPIRRLSRVRRAGDPAWDAAGPIYSYTDFRALAELLSPDDHALECADPQLWPELVAFIEMENDLQSGAQGVATAAGSTRGGGGGGGIDK